jgi:hypothetical protein
MTLIRTGRDGAGRGVLAVEGGQQILRGDARRVVVLAVGEHHASSASGRQAPHLVREQGGRIVVGGEPAQPRPQLGEQTFPHPPTPVSAG